MPRRQDHPSPQELRREAAHVEKSGHAEGGKNPGNVAGGKKAAATRKEHKSGHGGRSRDEE